MTSMRVSQICQQLRKSNVSFGGLRVEQNRNVFASIRGGSPQFFRCALSSSSSSAAASTSSSAGGEQDISYTPRQKVVAFALGVGAGCVSSWFNMSHGVICVPVLSIPPLNLAPQLAAGTTCFGVSARSMLAAVFLALGIGQEADEPRLEELMDANVVFVCGLAACWGAWRGATASALLSRKTLMKINGLAMIAISILMPWRDKVMDEKLRSHILRPVDELVIPSDVEIAFVSPFENGRRFDPSSFSASQSAQLVALGVFSGLLTGTVGVGAGWLLCPALLSLKFLDDWTMCQSTALAATAPATLVAAYKHFTLGQLSPLMWPLMIGAVTGGYIGAEHIFFPIDEQEEARFMLIMFSFLYGAYMIMRG